MNLDLAGLAALLGDVRRFVETRSPAAEVLYCAPAPYLAAAGEALRGSPVAWGAQNVHWETSGAYTGEVSASMLRDLGCRFVIVGHSERRTLFGEDDAAVHRKAQAAIGEGLVPILCVGESEGERERGETDSVLTRQIERGAGGLEPGGPGGLVVAYEPVWAIGTGKTATPEQAQAAHRHLRGLLERVQGPGIAKGLRILYGGSVNPGNAAELLGLPDVDGALVGGASLEAESFLAIVEAAG
jgi:triosephosphate isomerase